MSDQKFCISCGQQIPFSALFCPNCGQKQPQLQATTSAIPAISVTSQASVQPETASKPQAIDPKIFGKALNIEAVNRYRQNLGYTSTNNLVVYGYMLNMGLTFLVGAIGMLASKYYMISFEDDGILFLGIGLSSHFSGENSFINFKDLEEISFKDFGLNYHLTVTAKNGTMKARVGRLSIGQPWQAANVKILAQRYHK